jgi:16S rRNA processing protein RimM
VPRERDRLEIGKVGPPHGLKGDVHVTLHFAGSDALSAGARVWLVSATGAREFSLRSMHAHGRGSIAGFDGVDDRDSALALRGARLEVERSRLPPLADGEYYLVDLIGATAVGPDGPVGEVIGIAAHPSVASLELRLLDGRLAEQPLAAPWVAGVDVKAGRVELANLDGLVV